MRLCAFRAPTRMQHVKERQQLCMALEVCLTEFVSPCAVRAGARHGLDDADVGSGKAEARLGERHLRRVHACREFACTCVYAHARLLNGSGRRLELTHHMAMHASLHTRSMVNMPLRPSNSCDRALGASHRYRVRLAWADRLDSRAAAITDNKLGVPDE